MRSTVMVVDGDGASAAQAEAGAEDALVVSSRAAVHPHGLGNSVAPTRSTGCVR